MRENTVKSIGKRADRGPGPASVTFADAAAFEREAFVDACRHAPARWSRGAPTCAPWLHGAHYAKNGLAGATSVRGSMN